MQYLIVPPPMQRVSGAPLLDDGAPDPAARREVIATRYGCGDASLIVRHTPARQGWLNAFGAVGLRPAAVLRELPTALAVLSVEF